MEDLLNLFFRHLEFERGRSKNTLMAYKNDLHQFINVLRDHTDGPLLVEDLTPDLLTHFHNWLQYKGYQPSTINRKWAAVRSLFDYLRSEGYDISPNLLGGLDTQAVERTLPMVLSLEEIDRLLAAPSTKESPLAKRDSAILALMYFSGLRASDVVSLTLDQLDAEGSMIQSPWSSGILSIASSIDQVREYLLHGRPHLARDPEERALFLNQRGSGLTRQGLWLIVKRWVDAANIEAKVTPHTLRHSLAKHLLDSGWSLKEVQQKLGLKSPNSIRIFIKPIPANDGIS